MFYFSIRDLEAVLKSGKNAVPLYRLDFEQVVAEQKAAGAAYAVLGKAARRDFLICGWEAMHADLVLLDNEKDCRAGANEFAKSLGYSGELNFEIRDARVFPACREYPERKRKRKDAAGEESASRP